MTCPSQAPYPTRWRQHSNTSLMAVTLAQIYWRGQFGGPARALAPKKLRMALNILPPDGAIQNTTQASFAYLPQVLNFRVSVQSVKIWTMLTLKNHERYPSPGSRNERVLWKVSLLAFRLRHRCEAAIKKDTFRVKNKGLRRTYTILLSILILQYYLSSKL